MEKEYLDYLAHHGIKGQKWGERRFQNEDGTLTEEGKRRYGWYYSSQIDRLARERNKPYKKAETRERKQKEYDDLLRRVERKRKILGAASVGLLAFNTLRIANLATGGRFKLKAKRTMFKAASKTMSAVGSALHKMKNSRVVTDFIKRKNWRKNGVHVLKKSQFRVTPVGLPMGRG